jgi:hypothetical protein
MSMAVARRLRLMLRISQAVTNAATNDATHITAKRFRIVT